MAWDTAHLAVLCAVLLRPAAPLPGPRGRGRLAAQGGCRCGTCPPAGSGCSPRPPLLARSRLAAPAPPSRTAHRRAPLAPAADDAQIGTQRRRRLPRPAQPCPASPLRLEAAAGWAEWPQTAPPGALARPARPPGTPGGVQPGRSAAAPAQPPPAAPPRHQCRRRLLHPRLPPLPRPRHPTAARQGIWARAPLLAASPRECRPPPAAAPPPTARPPAQRRAAPPARCAASGRRRGLPVGWCRAPAARARPRPPPRPRRAPGAGARDAAQGPGCRLGRAPAALPPGPTQARAAHGPGGAAGPAARRCALPPASRPAPAGGGRRAGEGFASNEHGAVGAQERALLFSWGRQ